ncbi:hypothetical protein P9E76_21790 [Schinkia azotoformans]|uniref:hypothetical protein n=1 Tax=Schinkia azotoformans TaxID=1454 RepID=UPI0002D30E96|nr:hypothetical protein [Schinkia azotoformans]MEC1640933.1 hypothetical protein [Schinkia azotoformans]MEC1947627.1 hypothetical protein [Schinkia azotoformans]
MNAQQSTSTTVDPNFKEGTSCPENFDAGEIVERVFEGELTLSTILSSWLKKQFKGEQL